MQSLHFPCENQLLSYATTDILPLQGVKGTNQLLRKFREKDSQISQTVHTRI